MSSHSPEGPSHIATPQAELVEELLGVPLLLPSPDMDIKEGRMAASTAAYFFTLKMVRHHTGLAIPEDTSRKVKLPDTDMRELAALPDIAFLSREVRIANKIAEHSRRPLTMPEKADSPDTPRAQLQSKLVGRIAAHYVSLPPSLEYDPDSPLGVRLQDGFALIAKTGVGKTIMLALMLRLAGLTDKEVPGEPELEGTIVTSSIKLVKQLAGDSGNNTFRRFLGEDVKVSKITKQGFDTSGRIRLTTTRSIFRFDPGDVLAVDEGHHAVMGTQLADYLGRSSLRPLLLTATPAYNQRRDIRRLWSSFESPSTRKLIEDGILNPTRLLTFEYDDDPVPMVAATALAYMRTGRKVGIYCQPGNESAQARRIAALINEAAGERLIEAVGSHQPKSDAFEQEYDEGILRGLSTCKRLGEGWDAADADVGLIIEPGSDLQLEQNGGRFWRPGKFVTELCEFFKRGVMRKTSLWKILDLEVADPGKIIGYVEPSTSSGDSTRTSSGNSSNTNLDVLPLEDLPPIALDSLLVGVPLRRVLLGREDIQPSEGFTRKLATLAETHNVPVQWLQAQLDKQGFRYEGIREYDPINKEYTYDRWYEGEPVDTWIEENPLPELARKDEMNVRRIAEILETTPYHIEEVITELGLEPVDRLYQVSHQKGKVYGFDSFSQIHKKVEEKTPMAEETDVVLGAIGVECGSQFVASYIARVSHLEERPVQAHKRRNPVHGVRGIAIHISQDDAERIREERKAYDATPVADPTKHTPLVEAAKRAGLSLQIFEKRLTPEEYAAIVPLRYAPKKAPGRYLPNEITDAAVERLKAIELPPHLVPVRIYGVHFTIGRDKKALAWITEEFGEPEKYRIAGSVRDTPCITWEQLRAAEEKFGKRSSALEIDYDELVQGPNDTDPDRWEYTQQVQRYYLGAIPSHPQATPPEYIPEPVTETDPINLDTQSEPAKPQIAVKPVADPQPISVNQKTSSRPEPEPTVPPVIFSDAHTQPTLIPEPEPDAQPEPVVPSEEETKPPVIAPKEKEIEPRPATTKAEDQPDGETLKPLSDRQRREAIAAARGVGGPGRRHLPQNQEVRTPQTRPKTAVIPSNFTNIDEYMSDKCPPRILRALIKSKRIAIRKDENGTQWASDDDILQLEEAIQRYPIAKPNMITGEQMVREILEKYPDLPKEFPNLPLKPEHIFFVASKVVGSTAGHIELCRALQPDGTPGMLNHFYHIPIQAKIRERLDFIFNSTTRTRSLLRFGEF